MAKNTASRQSGFSNIAEKNGKITYAFINKDNPATLQSVGRKADRMPELFVPVYDIHTLINEEIFTEVQEDFYGRSFVIGALDDERPFLVCQHDKTRYWDARAVNDSCGEWMTSPKFIIGLKIDMLKKDGLYSNKVEEYLSRLAKELKEKNERWKTTGKTDLVYKGYLLQEVKGESPREDDDVIRVRKPQSKITLW